MCTLSEVSILIGQRARDIEKAREIFISEIRAFVGGILAGVRRIRSDLWTTSRVRLDLPRDIDEGIASGRFSQMPQCLAFDLITVSLASLLFRATIYSTFSLRSMREKANIRCTSLTLSLDVSTLTQSLMSITQRCKIAKGLVKRMGWIEVVVGSRLVCTDQVIVVVRSDLARRTYPAVHLYRHHRR